MVAHARKKLNAASPVIQPGPHFADPTKTPLPEETPERPDPVRGRAAPHSGARHADRDVHRARKDGASPRPAAAPAGGRRGPRGPGPGDGGAGRRAGGADLRDLGLLPEQRLPVAPAVLRSVLSRVRPLPDGHAAQPPPVSVPPAPD